MKFKKILCGITAAAVTSVLVHAAPESTSTKVYAETYLGTNYGNHNYDYDKYSRPVYSYFATTDSGYMRIQVGAIEDSILVEYYDSDYSLISTEEVDYELPIFGAFYETEENFYILSGQDNPDENDDVEVYRVTKYDKSWTRLGSASLYGENTIVPFKSGSARIIHQDNHLVVRTCHQMYTSDDGLNHQANVTFIVDTDAMAITDKFTGVEYYSVGYASHSFNQFVKIDDDNIIGVDHGDAYPRAVVLFKSNTNEEVYGNYESFKMLPIKGKKGDNYTGATVGGFEISDSSYIVAGTTIDQDDFNNSKTRNVFVSVLDKNNGKDDSNVEINMITDYTEDDESASNPHLVKIDDNNFLLIWEHDDEIHYTMLGGTGITVGEEYSFNGKLSDCAPIVADNKIQWYVWIDDIVEFYSINVSDFSASVIEVEMGDSDSDDNVSGGSSETNTSNDIDNTLNNPSSSGSSSGSSSYNDLNDTSNNVNDLDNSVANNNSAIDSETVQTSEAPAKPADETNPNTGAAAAAVPLLAAGAVLFAISGKRK